MRNNSADRCVASSWPSPAVTGPGRPNRSQAQVFQGGRQRQSLELLQLLCCQEAAHLLTAPTAEAGGAEVPQGEARASVQLHPRPFLQGKSLHDGDPRDGCAVSPRPVRLGLQSIDGSWVVPHKPSAEQETTAQRGARTARLVSALSGVRTPASRTPGPCGRPGQELGQQPSQRNQLLN